MKTLTTFITILFASILSSPCWSETVAMDNLVERDGIFFEKLKSVPFTGTTDKGLARGSFKAGKKEGLWVYFWDDGNPISISVNAKGKYINGNREGLWKFFYINGQLVSKSTYKTGKQEGFTEFYHEDGNLWGNGYWKDGKQDGLWKIYFVPSELSKESVLYRKESWKDGKEDGIWEYYNDDGTMILSTYKDGKLVSKEIVPK